jgi:hypothetical protein
LSRLNGREMPLSFDSAFMARPASLREAGLRSRCAVGGRWQTAPMKPLTLTDIENAVRASFGADTYPHDSTSSWNPDNPSRGQCGVASLVVNDLLGGELMRGEVHREGAFADFHWWNRLPGGIEIDLTRDQFAPHETVTPGTAIVRPLNKQIRRLRVEYETLRERVINRLDSMTG